MRKFLSFFLVLTLIFSLCACNKSNNTSTVMPGEYAVTFDYGYDNKKIIAKSENYKVAKPEEPTRKGYTFLGWCAANEKEYWNFTGHTVTENMTLTAKWDKHIYRIFYSHNCDGRFIKNYLGDRDFAPNVELYSLAVNVDFFLDNPSGPFDFRVPAAFTIDTPSFTIQELSKAGYTFLGWTYDGQPTPVKTVTIPKGTTKDYRLIANWERK